MSTVRDDAIKLIQSLPADCSLEEIQYHLYVRDKIDRGLADIDAGRTVSHDEVKKQVQEWVKSIGRNRP